MGSPFPAVLLFLGTLGPIGLSQEPGDDPMFAARDTLLQARRHLVGTGTVPTLYDRRVLIRIPAVQAELKLTDDQKKELRRLNKEFLKLSVN